MERDPGEARLRAMLARLGVEAEWRSFDVSCHSVPEAARAVGAREDEFVKSICFHEPSSRHQLVVAVVKGEDRASATRVQSLLGLAERPRLATGDEVLERTGYAAGGVPPLGFDAAFVVDERVLELPLVWAGGGSSRALLRVAPRDIVAASGARVGRARR